MQMIILFDECNIVEYSLSITFDINHIVSPVRPLIKFHKKPTHLWIHEPSSWIPLEFLKLFITVLTLILIPSRNEYAITECASPTFEMFGQTILNFSVCQNGWIHDQYLIWLAAAVDELSSRSRDHSGTITITWSLIATFSSLSA